MHRVPRSPGMPDGPAVIAAIVKHNCGSRLSVNVYPACPPRQFPSESIHPLRPLGVDVTEVSVVDPQPVHRAPSTASGSGPRQRSLGLDALRNNAEAVRFGVDVIQIEDNLQRRHKKVVPVRAFHVATVFTMPDTRKTQRIVGILIFRVAGRRRVHA